MNDIIPLLRRCLFPLILALMVTSDSTAQRFEPRIVFASNDDGNWFGNWDIYSMDVNGDNLLQLSDHPASDRAPACSSDGRRIAFISERGVTSDLYVMDNDGNNVIRLTHDNFFESRPSWSPDGTRIAFSSFRWAVGNSEIYAMDPDGNNLKNLTRHKWHDVTPSWSPDGRKIAFHSQHIFDPDVRYYIYVITAEGEELEKLTEEGSNRFPAYSPDGEKIAYVSHRNGDSNIYLMDTDGMNAVKLTNTPRGVDNIYPSWLFATDAFAVNPNGKLSISWGDLKRNRNP